MRKYIHLATGDNGKRIRSKVNVAILGGDKDSRKKGTTPGLRFSVVNMEKRALTMTYALVSTQECLVNSLFVTLLNLPMTRIDDKRHEAFGENGSIQPVYYKALVGILNDQMRASHALFHSQIGDLVANNKKVTVFPEEATETETPGQRMQCHHMEDLVHNGLLVALGKGLNGYIACLANAIDRMDDKCLPDQGISRQEVNTIYEMTMPVLTDVGDLMKRECMEGCYIVTDI
jgi:hypothetical protein